MAEESDSGESGIEKKIIDEALHRVLGVSIAELSQDLAARLNDPLFGIDMNLNMRFKQAKRRFKQDYLKKLLSRNFGNVSEVARIARINRRSIHRICNPKSLLDLRRETLSRKYKRRIEMESIITEVAKCYRNVLHPSKIQDLYHYAPTISDELVRILPDNPLPLKHAVRIFEKRYIEALVLNHQDLKTAARFSGIRYETLIRKMKKLGIRK